MQPRANIDDRSKVVIVGAGRVGSTTAFASLITGLAGTLVLVDQDEARAEGEAMDLLHGLPYLPPANIRAGGFEECREVDVVILTAGAAQQPGDSRLDLARHFHLDARNVHAYVVGEHGDSEVAVWSLARVANLSLSDFAQAAGKPWGASIEREIGEQVRRAGAEVIRRDGATHCAIGLATAQLTRTVLRDERSILTVSTVLQGEQGVTDVALSLPCFVQPNRSGIRDSAPIRAPSRRSSRPNR